MLVNIQHLGWGLSDKPPGRTFISEFGLSMHAESKRGSETRHLLMDFGFTHEALVNNINPLAIDPAELDTLVLSHGHYDHFVGSSGSYSKARASSKPSCRSMLAERSASAPANGSARRLGGGLFRARRKERTPKPTRKELKVDTHVDYVSGESGSFAQAIVLPSMSN